MTTSAELHPVRIPGYGGGPFTHRTEFLDENVFWLGHLSHCAQGAESEEAEELLFGADYDAAGDFQHRLFQRADWPAFTIPLTAGHRLHVVYRTVEGDEGTDYLLHHPDWEEAVLLARDEGCFMGPGLSWPELVAAADNALPGGSTTDAHARLLLLLPALGDDALPDHAADRLAVALRARTGVEAPEPLAGALLENQGLWGPAHWTTPVAGLRINDGEYSFRNPANRFALPAALLARVAAALAPHE
ncbi:hypothetical protein [Streptomyces sp. NA02950]|uniref:hypothetical protein n=1 Tax=Streptomyces sp. NA02950 TaxID=2742137 RepID=UPI0020CAD6E2|nr:hypothetical protein [Streptomyces sp. NA02950]